MSGVLVDTSFFAALLSPRDALHQQAVELSQQPWDERVTTEFILLELANFLAKSAVRNLLTDLVRRLQNDPATTIVTCTSEHFHRGLSLYASRPDKQWSLTDCISFQVMAERGLSDALTHDRHFEQAGFKALMR